MAIRNRSIDPRVRKAVPLIEQTCDEVLSVFGEKFRLARARQLLETATEPLYAVALKCGYKNQSHFASRFRAEFGVSPSSLRNR